MEKYYRGNFLQKEFNKVISIFRKDPDKIRYLEGKGIKTYHPKIKKWRVGVASSIFLALLVTPCTPEFLFLPKLIVWGIK